MITVTQFATRVKGHLQGTTTNRMKDFMETLKMSMELVLMNVDPKETLITEPLESLLYDQEYDYMLPADLKDDAVVDIRRQVQEFRSKNVGRATYTRDFNVEKSEKSGLFRVRYNKGVKTLRISESLTPPLVIDSCDTFDENGTWIAGAGVSNIVTDGNFYFAGRGAVRYDLSVAGTASIEKTDLPAVDLSTIEDIGALFMILNWPGAGSTLTSVKLEWGTDSSNKWEKTVTSSHTGSAFQQYVNSLRFDWKTATETGTPNASAITYLKITYIYTGQQLGVVMDNIVGKLGTPFEIEYYSRFGFRTSAGVWTDTPTTGSDIINLGNDAVNLLFFQFMALAQYELIDKSKTQSKNMYEIELHGSGNKEGLYDIYGSKFPSERVLPSTDTFEFDSDMEVYNLSGYTDD